MTIIGERDALIQVTKDAAALGTCAQEFTDGLTDLVNRVRTRMWSQMRAKERASRISFLKEIIGKTVASVETAPECAEEIILGFTDGTYIEIEGSELLYWRRAFPEGAKKRGETHG